MSWLVSAVSIPSPDRRDTYEAVERTVMPSSTVMSSPVAPESPEVITTSASEVMFSLTMTGLWVVM